MTISLTLKKSLRKRSQRNRRNKTRRLLQTKRNQNRKPKKARNTTKIRWTRQTPNQFRTANKWMERKSTARTTKVKRACKRKEKTR